MAERQSRLTRVWVKYESSQSLSNSLRLPPYHSCGTKCRKCCESIPSSTSFAKRRRLVVRVAANCLVKITLQRGASGPRLLSEIMIAKNIICRGVQKYHSNEKKQVGSCWTGQQHSERRKEAFSSSILRSDEAPRSDEIPVTKQSP